MERIDAGQPFRVLVDYAHTPNSFENVLTEGRALSELGGRAAAGGVRLLGRARPIQTPGDGRNRRPAGRLVRADR